MTKKSPVLFNLTGLFVALGYCARVCDVCTRHPEAIVNMESQGAVVSKAGALLALLASGSLPCGNSRGAGRDSRCSPRTLIRHRIDDARIISSVTKDRGVDEIA